MSEASLKPQPASPDHILLHDNLPREHGFEPLRVDGELPADLSGTLYRNGPGLFELFGRRNGHPFEGDGAITAVRFGRGEAHGAARLVESEGLVKERAAGRRLYGTSAPVTTRLRNAYRGESKNVANTNVIAWQGKLLALMEAGKPTELSLDDLSTLGETDLDGVIKSMFSAHPHAVAARKALYNFGLRYGRNTYLDLYELPEAGAARCIGSVPLAQPVMLHDFIATANHLVFFVSPVRIRVMRAMLRMGSFHDMFEWRPNDGVEVIVVPIDDPTQVVRFRADTFFQWHFANAFERRGSVIVDVVRYPDFGSFDWLTDGTPHDPGQLYRMTVDPDRKTLTHAQLHDAPCEFPRVHPAREGEDYQSCWLATRELQAIGCMNVQDGTLTEYQLGLAQRTSEPVFVPRAGAADERDGYVLSLIYDGDTHTSFMGVFDGQRLEDGPIARAHFDHHIPITFHGNWVE